MKKIKRNNLHGLKQKYWFNILFYSSIIFLLIALYNGDYFHFPEIKSYGLFFVSILFLLGGFLIEAFAWKNLLRIKGYEISSGSAVVASGLSVFTKYIPGKIMIVLSRSTYLNKTLGLPLKEIGILSLFSQLLNLLIGCFIGFFCFQLWELSLWLILLFIASFTALLFICFSPLFSILLTAIFKKVLKKTIRISKISIKEFFSISHWFFLFWFSYSLGFWLLTASVSENMISLNDSLFYPPSMVVGVLAIFAPGGLGIREGVLGYFLSTLDWKSVQIVSFAVTTRIWFLIGEVLFFVIALLFTIRTRNQD